MSTLLWIALSLYGVSFILLFFFVKNEERQEEKPGSLPVNITTAAMLALIVVLSFIGLMLVPMGVMFIGEGFFPFQTDMGHIVFIGGMVLLYVLALDHAIHVVIQKSLQHHPIHLLLLNALRFFIFIGISTFVSVPTMVSMWMALALTVLFVFIDIGSYIFSKKEQPHAE